MNASKTMNDEYRFTETIFYKSELIRLQYHRIEFSTTEINLSI